MTQAQFARLIGVSISTINNWEKNKGALKLQTRTRKALTEAIQE
jgi:DNA-binding XRE family transcriptional regulator